MQRVERVKIDVSLPYTLSSIAGFLIIAGSVGALTMLGWHQSLFGMGRGMTGGAGLLFNNLCRIAHSVLCQDRTYTTGTLAHK
jgi:hypothetical protein